MKNIIITGASRGIGKELARIHLEKGNNVFTIARSAAKLEELNQYATQSDHKSMALDLANYEDINKVLEPIKDWNKVDVLYNNAGLCVNKPFEKVNYQDLDNSWRINFLGPFRLIQLLKPLMKQGAHIVNTSTMGAIQGSVKFPGLSAYSSSKAAITNLTELLAEEFKECGIAVNCLALGAVQTEMLEEAFPGYEAPLSAIEMAEYLYNFGLDGAKYFNGKLIQVSSTTP